MFFVDCSFDYSGCKPEMVCTLLIQFALKCLLFIWVSCLFPWSISVRIGIAADVCRTQWNGRHYIQSRWKQNQMPSQCAGCIKSEIQGSVQRSLGHWRNHRFEFGHFAARFRMFHCLLIRVIARPNPWQRPRCAGNVVYDFFRKRPGIVCGLFNQTHWRTPISSIRPALAFDLDDVKEFCVNEFVENFKTIMHHEKSQCTAEALSQILDLELLCPEREIFEICMPWSAAMAVAATDASTLRSLLGTSVQKIRFTSMTNEEFSEIVVKYPGFFAIRSFRNLFGHFEGKCQRCQRNGQRLLCCGQNSLTTHCPQWQGMKEFFCIFALCGCRTAMVYTLLIHHLRERRGKICSKI